jgi:hypothetical protein
MPRDRSRACLNDGLKLDLNRLARRGFVRRGALSGRHGIAWNHSYWGELASGVISADMSGERAGWLRLELGGSLHVFELAARGRHFGGRQWYFVCPSTGRLASVLWYPPGARSFRSREGWGRRVAYQSQFLDPDNRAHRGQAKIKARLLGPDMDPDEWELPPKPKGMRWRTYQRHVDRFDRYEEILDMGMVGLAAKLLGKNII